MDRGELQRSTVRRLALDSAALEALDALTRSGIACILLKGPVTAARLYHNESRPYLDIDILVPPAQAARSVDVLAALGYALRGSSVVAHDLRRERDGAAVDLHVTVAGAGAPADEVWRVLSEYAAAFSLHGRSVVALDEAAHAWHLALHSVSTGGARSKPSLDLERAIALYPMPIWREAVNLAEKLGDVDVLTTGLRGYATGGGRLADELGLPSGLRWSARLRARDGTGLTHASEVWRQRDWRGRAVLLRGWCMPDPALVYQRLGVTARRGSTPGRYVQALLTLRARQTAGLLRAGTAACRPGVKPEV